MDIFGSALDTIIVGALAIPWVLLVYHLFFFHGVAGSKQKPHAKHGEHSHGGVSSDEQDAPTDGHIRNLWKWIKGPSEAAIAGVVLFAVAYSLGSAVSRVAQDFFDDSDNYGLWLTETQIRVQVYCQTMIAISKQEAFGKHEDATKPPEISTGSSTAPVVASTAKSSAAATLEKQEKETTDNNDSVCTSAKARKKRSIGDVIFQLHEAALLLLGTDANERLRLFHDQIMVLRGAAFNGIVAFSLCFFWWCAGFASPWRMLAVAPYLALGGAASFSHVRRVFSTTDSAGAFYFEFSLIILFAAGLYLLWPGHDQAESYRRGGAKEIEWHKRCQKILFGYTLLAALLTVTDYLGWWATEILYDQQVIYSYKAFIEHPPDATAPATPSQR